MVQLLIHHKWFIRLALATFWTAEIVAHLLGGGFITYLLTYQTLPMLIIIFLSFKYMLEPFYAPFVKITTDGGEIMKKSTILLVSLVAALLTLVVAMAIEPSRIAIITFLQNSVANPIYLAGVAVNTWLGTYPALWTLGAGTLAGLLLAIIIKYRAFFKRNKLPSIRSTSQTSSVGSVSLSQTPSNATTRPETTVTTENLIEVTPEPEVKSEEQK